MGQVAPHHFNNQPPGMTALPTGTGYRKNAVTGSMHNTPGVETTSTPHPTHLASWRSKWRSAESAAAVAPMARRASARRLRQGVVAGAALRRRRCVISLAVSPTLACVTMTGHCKMQ